MTEVSGRMPCEFTLVRYVPDVVKGEFVNIGVLLREAASGGAEVRTRVRFTRDWARVRCMDADADVALLEALEQEIVARLDAGVNAREPKSVLETLEDSLSNSLQMTEPRATLAENLTTGMEELMRLYVEPLRVARTRTASVRATIAGSMRREFERTGAWGLMRKRIPAAMYTRAGDPLRLECGYRSLPSSTDGERIRMFQAISLDRDVETAKGLAFSAPQLRDGVRRIEAAELELTAVVEPLKQVAGEDNEGEAYERYRFGVEAMEREQIRVITLNDLARAALTAQRELGL